MTDSTSSSPTPATSSTPPSTPEPWRAPATGPAWAAGKTAEEILSIAAPAVEMLDKFNLSGKVIGQPPQSLTPQGYGQPTPAGYGQPQTGYAQPPQAAQPDPNEYPTWGQMQAWLQQQAQQSITPQITGLYENQAATNLQWLRGQDRYKVVFDKFGPEFNVELAKLQPHVRTLDNLQMLADLVKGRHVDEIARERAAELAATTPPTMRSNGFAGSTGALPQDNGLGINSEKVPAAWREKAVAAGITDEVIAEWCRANNQTPQQFFEMVAKSKIVTGTSDIRNEDGRVVGRETRFG